MRTCSAYDPVEIIEFYERNPELVSGVISSGFFSDKEKTSILGLFLGDIRGLRALDIGCGNAELVEILFECGVREYVGVDIAPSVLQQSRSHHRNGSFIIADMHSLVDVFEPNEFDLVLLLDVWEHSAKPDQCLKEIHYVLRPGGKLMMSIPNYSNLAGLKKLWQERFGSYRADSWAPFCNERAQILERFTTSSQLRKSLIRTGFRILVERGWDIVAGFFPSIYAADGLKGFWGRYSHWHYAINRFAFMNFHAITSICSMYYLVSAVNIEQGKERSQ